jgi:hypothetical protein
VPARFTSAPANDNRWQQFIGQCSVSAELRRSAGQ